MEEFLDKVLLYARLGVIAATLVTILWWVWFVDIFWKLIG
jgi:hypothetical protein